MSVIYALIASFSAAMSSIFLKYGLKNISAQVATLIRVGVIFLFALLIWLIFGNMSMFTKVRWDNGAYLFLSGLCTTASWYFYNKALKAGNVNKVVSVDKSSIIISFILSFIVFQEKMSIGLMIGMPLVVIGIYLQINFKEIEKKEFKSSWLMYAFLSALAAGAIPVLNKLGTRNLESSFALLFRTIVVLVVVGVTFAIKYRKDTFNTISRKDIFLLVISGVATGISWLLILLATKIGDIVVVTTIDKASVVVTLILGIILFSEKLSIKNYIGLSLIVSSIFLMIFV